MYEQNRARLADEKYIHTYGLAEREGFMCDRPVISRSRPEEEEGDGEFGEVTCTKAS